MAGSNAMRPQLGRLLRPIGGTPTCPPVAARTAAFSTTAPQHKRKTRDNNPKRGVSSLYRSGPRERLSMSDVPLPKPRDFKPKLAVDKTHGLWGFFPEPGKALNTPEELGKHGRAWTVEELRRKSWEDLHSLWWVCCRERNMLATSKQVISWTKLGFGSQEIQDREDVIRKTMRAIKHALTERYYTWEDAVEVAKVDPEIKWGDEGGELFTPSAYEDEYEAEQSWTEPGKEGAEPAVEAMQPGTAPVEGEAPAPHKEATR